MRTLYSTPLRPAPTTNQPSRAWTSAMPAAIWSANHAASGRTRWPRARTSPPAISTRVIVHARAVPAGKPLAARNPPNGSTMPRVARAIP